MVAPLAAVVASFGAAALAELGLAAAPNVVTLAALVTFLPGMALTIGMRELATDHLQSGVANTARALVQLLGLVVGVGVGRSIAEEWFGPAPDVLPDPTFSSVNLLAAVAAGLAFTVTLRARFRDAWAMCAATVLALSARELGEAAFGAQAAVFVAALAVGVAGGLVGGRLHRSPLVFIVPGVLMLVPGSAGFNSALQLLANQTVTGIAAAFDTFVTAMSIAYGLMVSTLVLPRRHPGHAHDDCRRSSVGPRGRRDPRPAHARRGAVPDDAGQLGHERLHRDRRGGRRHDGDGHPGGDHGVHAGDGGADDHRGQDRRDDRPQARVRDRLRHLRVRVVHDVDRAEPAGAALRLVVPRGRRRGADPAGDRRARGRKLPDRAAAGGLRARRRCRCDRGRGRPADRRLLHDVLLVALGLRRRGRARAGRSSCSRAASPTRPPRSGPQLDVVGAVLSAAGLGHARLRRAPLERVGLDPAEARRSVVGRALAHRLADPRGRLRALALLALADPARQPRRGAARAARAC